jgi:hypothetical protein
MSDHITFTAGEDMLLSAVLTESSGALTLTGCRFELRTSKDAAVLISKTLGSGISVTSTTTATATVLITIPASQSDDLSGSYHFTIIGETSAQKSVALTGYITINKPTIS